MYWISWDTTSRYPLVWSGVKENLQVPNLAIFLNNKDLFNSFSIIFSVNGSVTYYMLTAIAPQWHVNVFNTYE